MAIWPFHVLKPPRFWQEVKMNAQEIREQFERQKIFREKRKRVKDSVERHMTWLYDQLAIIDDGEFNKFALTGKVVMRMSTLEENEESFRELVLLPEFDDPNIYSAYSRKYTSPIKTEKFSVETEFINQFLETGVDFVSVPRNDPACLFVVIFLKK